MFCLALVAGCQGYDPQPLDDAAHTEHAAQWRARSPDSAAVADYARELAATGAFTGKFDLADGIQLPEAEVIALFFNPGLRAVRAEAAVALAGAQQAGRWEDPELEINAAYILGNVDKPWVLGGMLKFTLPLSGRHGVEEDKAWAEHRLTLTRVVQAEWETLSQLRRHWVEAAALAEELRLTRQLIASLEALSRRAEALAQAGALARLDARLVALELAQRRLEELVVSGQLDDAHARLREDMGLHPDAPFSPRPQLPKFARPDGAATQLDRRNPALRVARAEYEVSQQALRLEIRKQYPDIVIGGGYENEDGQSRIALGLGFPLPIINLNREGIARARAARAASRDAYFARREAATHELARALAASARAAQQADLVNRAIVPLADANAAEAARLAELGEFDALRQLEAITRQHEARLALLRAEAGMRLADTAVLAAVGPDWRDAPKEDQR
ncbi:MAG: TolC family protein [Planctomycetes bacterium]|nr:TolC family protein [Planctomycetota bacterium]